MESQKKPVNDIRVGFNSRIGGLVNYCERLLKENNIRELNFSAVGGSIGTLVTVVEVLKTLHAGFYQINRFATISYQSVEEGKKGEVQNQRLYPKLEVKLTLDKPAKTGGEGYQEPLEEEERKKLLDIHSKRREGRPPRRGFRGRGRGRGRGRFRRGPGFRGRRGFRGRGRGRPMRGRGRPPMRGRGMRGRGRPSRGRGTRGPRS
jgi:hypothetical protein